MPELRAFQPYKNKRTPHACLHTTFLLLNQDKEALQDICKEIVKKLSEAQNIGTKEKKEGSTQSLLSLCSSC